MTAQHRLLVIDLAIAVRRRQKRKVTMQKRIKWFKLKNQDHKLAFKDRVLRGMDREMEDVNGWWKRVSGNILRAGKEIFGANSGKIWENKET